MLAGILSWLGGLLGGPFAQAAVSAYKDKLDSDNTSEKINADLLARKLQLDQREDELNEQLLIAEQGSFLTRCIRPMFALPFVIYYWKLIVYDKVLAALTGGVTDPLSPELQQMSTIILTAYFIGRSVEKSVATLKK